MPIASNITDVPELFYCFKAMEDLRFFFSITADDAVFSQTLKAVLEMNKLRHKELKSFA